MDSDSSQPIEVTIEAQAWNTIVTDPRQLVTRAAETALGELDAAERVRAEIGILLTDNIAVRALNKEYRGRDRPTNVLSFPSFGRDQPRPDHGPLLFGDVILALETVKAEADALADGFSGHVSHLVIHGILHLFGHDHENNDEAQKMERAERRLMAQLGFGDPYSDDDLQGSLTEEAV
ncbi:MAG: rRNA maturation RNase YbeY [Pseudomonadota bacterium]